MNGTAPENRWLLIQTLATGPSRRALQSSLPLVPGARIVDVGCGYGASSLELAGLRPADVTGVDRDPRVLEVARDATAALRQAGVLAPGSTVRFMRGDAYDLPFADGSADAVFSRFVFQHLSDPAAAAAEIHRVLRPGGIACVVDVDDGLSISEPPASDAFTRLASALRASQTGYGGDRHIGRRLASLLDFQGLVPTTVLVLPHAAYHRPSPDDAPRRLLLERLRAAQALIVGGGHMTAEEFEADLSCVASEAPGPVCEIEAHLAVVAQAVR